VVTEDDGELRNESLLFNSACGTMNDDTSLLPREFLETLNDGYFWDVPQVQV
jgi:hypothetical protein